MLPTDLPETVSNHHERRSSSPPLAFVEVAEIAILEAAEALGTLRTRGATPQALVDQVREHYVIREADFARAIGRLVACDQLDVVHGDAGWTYALTHPGKQHIDAWHEQSQAASDRGLARLSPIHHLLSSRARQATRVSFSGAH